MSESALLARVGETLFGQDWRGPLAAELGVEARAVKRWEKNVNRVPKPVWEDLGCLLYSYAADAESLAKELEEQMLTPRRKNPPRG